MTDNSEDYEILPEVRNPEEWKQNGACLGLDVSLFYPDPTGDGVKDAMAAKKVCASCPVRLDCLTYGVHHEKYGIWGGTSERQRQRIRTALGIKLKNPGGKGLAK